MNKDLLIILLNLIIGFLTLILSYILPIGGGGISLIFVLTVPICIAFSIITSIVYYILAKKQKVYAKNILMVTSIILNLIFTFTSFPYA